MRRVMASVAFVVVVFQAGGARGAEFPDEPDDPEAPGEAAASAAEDEEEEEADVGGAIRAGRPRFDQDEDEDQLESGGARIVELPAAGSAAPQPLRVEHQVPAASRVAAPIAPAAAPTLGAAPRSTSSTHPGVSGSASAELEFDPYADRPVRAYLGAAGLGTFILRQPPGREAMQAGGGITLFAGVDLGPFIGLELAYTGSFHSPGWGCADSWSEGLCGGNHMVVDLVSLDVRLHLPTGTHLVPFLQAGGLLGWIGRDNRMPTASGAGFEAGGGIEGWVGEYVTLGTKVLYRGLQATEPLAARGTPGGFVHMLTTSIELGVHF